MKGKVIRESASLEEMKEYAASIDATNKGVGGEPDVGRLDATRGDPRCPSDWIVVDCFWCATSNCVNPRWHVASCRNCHGPFTY
jgi:hypothetical protein